MTLATTEMEGEEVMEGRLTCRSNHLYTISSGLPNLVYPAELLASDREFLKQYDEGAEDYDEMAAFLFKLFFEEEAESRGRLADMLEAQPGDTVLEVSCGTGSNLPHIHERIHPGGELYALDLSPGMLSVAMAKTKRLRLPVRFYLANGAFLPFADQVFDALLHVGGLNTFSEVERALSEMTRVVRVGGKVVISDEGLAPWLRETQYGETLLTTNALYKHEPPLASLPPKAQDVRIHWVMGNAFYLIEYRVGERPPELNLDLRLPGSKDTVRSMLEKRG